MPGLVLEGGTFRPLFSCGVLDALLQHSIKFPYCIGVSAGISDSISYFAGQQGREIEIIRKYRNDKRYLGINNLKKDKSLFGLDFIFGEIPEKLVPLDKEAFMKYNGSIHVGVTNARTGEAEYMDCRNMDEKYTMLRATCALPMFFPPIEIDGEKYYDGGISDPIPVKKAIRDGNRKNLIILTRPKEYVKTLKKSNIILARRMEKEFPQMAELLVNRHIHYNKTVRYCEHLETEGRAVIIRPEHPLDSFQKDIKKLIEAHDEGFALAEKKLDEINQLWM